MTSGDDIHITGKRKCEEMKMKMRRRKRREESRTRTRTGGACS
jgi:hypothetical protein